MHKFLACACNSQDFAQGQKKFALSHAHVIVTFRNSGSMWIKINHEKVGPFKLVGGSPAGSFLGQLCYKTGCHDNTDLINDSEDDKYPYIYR